MGISHYDTNNLDAILSLIRPDYKIYHTHSHLKFGSDTFFCLLLPDLVCPVVAIEQVGPRLVKHLNEHYAISRSALANLRWKGPKRET